MARFISAVFILAHLIVVTAAGISEIHLEHSPGLTFSSGDDNFQITSLSYLYYAKVVIGTPPVSYILALDTGSSKSWIACNCDDCPRIIISPELNLNLSIYSPKSSSTSKIAQCGSPSKQHACAYNLTYSDGTSSSGVYVTDILHLSTYEVQPKSIDAEVIFGCGMHQTGNFLYDSAVNGILGLGPNKDNMDFLGTLASKGIVGNSFSLCFSFDGHGRLVFGDIGVPDQGETPFDLTQDNGGYNVQITQVAVYDKVSDVSITALFDTGTSFTYLSNPAYSFITKNLNALIKDPPIQQIDYNFEYCYHWRANQTYFPTPPLKLTMKGGHTFDVFAPIFVMKARGVRSYYCLAISKSNVNVIGQNFMTGYRLIFDRKKQILGWKKSECKANQFNITTYPIDKKKSSAKASVPTLTSVVVILVYYLALHV